MSRPKLEVDMEAAIDLLTRGVSTKDTALELGISNQTLSNRIADLQKKQGLLLQYRAIQSLQLTELQARVLEAITPEKIEEAPLRDLIMSYKILKANELVVEGKPSEIKGLVSYLIHLEKQEAALASGAPTVDYEEAEFTDNPNEEPSLSELDEQGF